MLSFLPGSNMKPHLIVFPDVRAESGEDASDGCDDGEGEGDADHGVHDTEQAPSRRHGRQITITYERNYSNFGFAKSLLRGTNYLVEFQVLTELDCM